MHTYICLYREVSLSSQGFLSRGFYWSLLSGRFYSGWFLSVPLLSEYISYNRKLNITFTFRFHMYEKEFEKCDVTCSWISSPVINCHTFSDPLPLERDVGLLYGRPLSNKTKPNHLHSIMLAKAESNASKHIMSSKSPDIVLLAS